jgi:hypothetical protein
VRKLTADKQKSHCEAILNGFLPVTVKALNSYKDFFWEIPVPKSLYFLHYKCFSIWKSLRRKFGLCGVKRDRSGKLKIFRYFVSGTHKKI